MGIKNMISSNGDAEYVRECCWWADKRLLPNGMISETVTSLHMSRVDESKGVWGD